MQLSPFLCCFLLTLLWQELSDASPRREMLTQRRSGSEGGGVEGRASERRIPDLSALVESTRRRQHHHHGHHTRESRISRHRSFLKQISTALERAQKKAGRGPSDIKSIPPVHAVYSGKGRSSLNTVKRVPNAPNVPRPRNIHHRHRPERRNRFSLPLHLAARRRQSHSVTD